jgi:hypothetical protein
MVIYKYIMFILDKNRHRHRRNVFRSAILISPPRQCVGTFSRVQIAFKCTYKISSINLNRDGEVFLNEYFLTLKFTYYNKYK